MSLLIFSHGNGFPANTYQTMLDALSQRGFTVAAVDKFGHDPAYPVTPNWPNLVQQLANFTEQQLALQPSTADGDTSEPGGAWLVGHSLGGGLSLMCAAQHPHLVRGVVMLDAILLSGWRAKAMGVATRAPGMNRLLPSAVSRSRREHWPSAQAAREHFAAKQVFAQWQPQALDDYVAGFKPDPAGGVRLGFDRTVESAIYDCLPHGLEALLREHPLKRPAAFIAGAKSREMAQLGLDLARSVTQGRMTTLDGSHLFPMERPQASAAAVEAAILNMQGL
jgi:pimeloyl-ACP methyl ester carboxylesterase